MQEVAAIYSASYNIEYVHNIHEVHTSQEVQCNLGLCAPMFILDDIYIPGHSGLFKQ